MLEVRELARTTPLRGGLARLDDICRRAIARANAGSNRLVAYVPQSGAGGEGCWDAASLTHALSLLVEEVLLATSPRERVELRWRMNGEQAIIRVRYPRPLGAGERLVTFFDAVARACEDRRRLVEARETILAEGGTLARVRTRRGTTYVVTVPRCNRRRSRGVCPTCSDPRLVERSEAPSGRPALEVVDRELPRTARAATPIRDPVRLWRRRRLANHAAMIVLLSALLVVIGGLAVLTAIQHADGPIARAAAAVPLAAAAGTMLWARSVRAELVRLEGEA